ncbi:uncharacterized protein LOC130893671 isoform X2 [Diorhabda carinulata]|uniref:uncharacterized protein LOC130893671 isoform X2 n=1 Tax=Diorhabda carinulata TaxID=1163345 RepID=UPI0025A07848|nr:uncharacterized protein LOC130893671 isoform X2 [Diorhabda carinulata]
MEVIRKRKKEVWKIRRRQTKITNLFLPSTLDTFFKYSNFCICRKMKSKRKVYREVPTFADTVRNEVLYLHEYNLTVFKVTQLYPFSEEYTQFLMQYVLLECKILYRREYYSKNREKQTQERVLRVLLNIYNDYFESKQLKRREITERSMKSIIEIFVKIRTHYNLKYIILENMTVTLLKKNGHFEKIDALRDKPLPFLMDSNFSPDPSLCIYRNASTSDYGTDDGLSNAPQILNVDNCYELSPTMEEDVDEIKNEYEPILGSQEKNVNKNTKFVYTICLDESGLDSDEEIVFYTKEIETKKKERIKNCTAMKTNTTLHQKLHTSKNYQLHCKSADSIKSIIEQNSASGINDNDDLLHQIDNILTEYNYVEDKKPIVISEEIIEISDDTTSSELPTYETIKDSKEFTHLTGSNSSREDENHMEIVDLDDVIELSANRPKEHDKVTELPTDKFVEESTEFDRKILQNSSHQTEVSMEIIDLDEEIEISTNKSSSPYEITESINRSLEENEDFSYTIVTSSLQQIESNNRISNINEATCIENNTQLPKIECNESEITFQNSVVNINSTETTEKDINLPDSQCSNSGLLLSSDNEDISPNKFLDEEVSSEITNKVKYKEICPRELTINLYQCTLSDFNHFFIEGKSAKKKCALKIKEKIPFEENTIAQSNIVQSTEVDIDIYGKQKSANQNLQGGDNYNTSNYPENLTVDLNIGDNNINGNCKTKVKNKRRNSLRTITDSEEKLESQKDTDNNISDKFQESITNDPDSCHIEEISSTKPQPSRIYSLQSYQEFVESHILENSGEMEFEIENHNTLVNPENQKEFLELIDNQQDTIVQIARNVEMKRDFKEIDNIDENKQNVTIIPEDNIIYNKNQIHPETLDINTINIQEDLQMDDNAKIQKINTEEIDNISYTKDLNVSSEEGNKSISNKGMEIVHELTEFENKRTKNEKFIKRTVNNEQLNIEVISPVNEQQIINLEVENFKETLREEELVQVEDLGVTVDNQTENEKTIINTNPEVERGKATHKKENEYEEVSTNTTIGIIGTIKRLTEAVECLVENITTGIEIENEKTIVNNSKEVEDKGVTFENVKECEDVSIVETNEQIGNEAASYKEIPESFHMDDVEVSQTVDIECKEITTVNQRENEIININGEIDKEVTTFEKEKDNEEVSSNGKIETVIGSDTEFPDSFSIENEDKSQMVDIVASKKEHFNENIFSINKSNENKEQIINTKVEVFLQGNCTKEEDIACMEETDKNDTITIITKDNEKISPNEDYKAMDQEETFLSPNETIQTVLSMTETKIDTKFTNNDEELSREVHAEKVSEIEEEEINIELCKENENFKISAEVYSQDELEIEKMKNASFDKKSNFREERESSVMEIPEKLQNTLVSQKELETIEDAERHIEEKIVIKSFVNKEEIEILPKVGLEYEHKREVEKESSVTEIQEQLQETMINEKILQGEEVEVSSEIERVNISNAEEIIEIVTKENDEVLPKVRVEDELKREEEQESLVIEVRAQSGIKMSIEKVFQIEHDKLSIQARSSDILNTEEIKDADQQKNFGNTQVDTSTILKSDNEKDDIYDHFITEKTLDNSQTQDSEIGKNSIEDDTYEKDFSEMCSIENEYVAIVDKKITVSDGEDTSIIEKVPCDKEQKENNGTIDCGQGMHETTCNKEITQNEEKTPPEEINLNIKTQEELSLDHKTLGEGIENGGTVFIAVENVNKLNETSCSSNDLVIHIKEISIAREIENNQSTIDKEQKVPENENSLKNYGVVEPVVQTADRVEGISQCTTKSVETNHEYSLYKSPFINEVIVEAPPIEEEIFIDIAKDSTENKISTLKNIGKTEKSDYPDRKEIIQEETKTNLLEPGIISSIIINKGILLSELDKKESASLNESFSLSNFKGENKEIGGDVSKKIFDKSDLSHSDWNMYKDKNLNEEHFVDLHRLATVAVEIKQKSETPKSRKKFKGDAKNAKTKTESTPKKNKSVKGRLKKLDLMETADKVDDEKRITRSAYRKNIYENVMKPQEFKNTLSINNVKIHQLPDSLTNKDITDSDSNDSEFNKLFIDDKKVEDSEDKIYNEDTDEENHEFNYKPRLLCKDNKGIIKRNVRNKKPKTKAQIKSYDNNLNPYVSIMRLEEKNKQKDAGVDKDSNSPGNEYSNVEDEIKQEILKKSTLHDDDVNYPIYIPPKLRYKLSCKNTVKFTAEKLEQRLKNEGSDLKEIQKIEQNVVGELVNEHVENTVKDFGKIDKITDEIPVCKKIKILSNVIISPRRDTPNNIKIFEEQASPDINKSIRDASSTIKNEGGCKEIFNNIEDDIGNTSNDVTMLEGKILETAKQTSKDTIKKKNKEMIQLDDRIKDTPKKHRGIKKDTKDVPCTEENDSLKKQNIKRRIKFEEENINIKKVKTNLHKKEFNKEINKKVELTPIDRILRKRTTRAASTNNRVDSTITEDSQENTSLNNIVSKETDTHIKSKKDTDLIEVKNKEIISKSAPESTSNTKENKDKAEIDAPLPFLFDRKEIDDIVQKYIKNRNSRSTRRNSYPETDLDKKLRKPVMDSTIKTLRTSKNSISKSYIGESEISTGSTMTKSRSKSISIAECLKLVTESDFEKKTDETKVKIRKSGSSSKLKVNTIENKRILRTKISSRELELPPKVNKASKVKKSFRKGISKINYAEIVEKNEYKNTNITISTIIPKEIYHNVTTNIVQNIKNQNENNCYEEKQQKSINIEKDFNYEHITEKLNETSIHIIEESEDKKSNITNTSEEIDQTEVPCSVEDSLINEIVEKCKPSTHVVEESIVKEKIFTNNDHLSEDLDIEITTRKINISSTDITVKNIDKIENIMKSDNISEESTNVAPECLKIETVTQSSNQTSIENLQKSGDHKTDLSLIPGEVKHSDYCYNENKEHLQNVPPKESTVIDIPIDTDMMDEQVCQETKVENEEASDAQQNLQKEFGKELLNDDQDIYSTNKSTDDVPKSVTEEAIKFCAETNNIESTVVPLKRTDEIKQMDIKDNNLIEKTKNLLTEMENIPIKKFYGSISQNNLKKHDMVEEEINKSRGELCDMKYSKKEEIKKAGNKVKRKSLRLRNKKKSLLDVSKKESNLFTFYKTKNGTQLPFSLQNKNNEKTVTVDNDESIDALPFSQEKQSKTNIIDREDGNKEIEKKAIAQSHKSEDACQESNIGSGIGNEIVELHKYGIIDKDFNTIDKDDEDSGIENRKTALEITELHKFGATQEESEINSEIGNEKTAMDSTVMPSSKIIHQDCNINTIIDQESANSGIGDEETVLETGVVNEEKVLGTAMSPKPDKVHQDGKINKIEQEGTNSEIEKEEMVLGSAEYLKSDVIHHESDIHSGIAYEETVLENIKSPRSEIIYQDCNTMTIDRENPNSRFKDEELGLEKTDAQKSAVTHQDINIGNEEMVLDTIITPRTEKIQQDCNINTIINQEGTNSGIDDKEMVLETLDRVLDTTISSGSEKILQDCNINKVDQEGSNSGIYGKEMVFETIELHKSDVTHEETNMNSGIINEEKVLDTIMASTSEKILQNYNINTVDQEGSNSGIDDKEMVLETIQSHKSDVTHEETNMNSGIINEEKVLDTIMASTSEKILQNYNINTVDQEGSNSGIDDKEMVLETIQSHKSDVTHEETNMNSGIINEEKVLDTIMSSTSEKILQNYNINTVDQEGSNSGIDDKEMVFETIELHKSDVTHEETNINSGIVNEEMVLDTTMSSTSEKMIQDYNINKVDQVGSNSGIDDKTMFLQTIESHKSDVSHVESNKNSGTGYEEMTLESLRSEIIHQDYNTNIIQQEDINSRLVNTNTTDAISELKNKEIIVDSLMSQKFANTHEECNIKTVNQESVNFVFENKEIVTESIELQKYEVGHQDCIVNAEDQEDDGSSDIENEIFPRGVELEKSESTYQESNITDTSNVIAEVIIESSKLENENQVLHTINENLSIREETIEELYVHATENLETTETVDTSKVLLPVSSNEFESKENYSESLTDTSIETSKCNNEIIIKEREEYTIVNNEELRDILISGVTVSENYQSEENKIDDIKLKTINAEVLKDTVIPCPKEENFSENDQGHSIREKNNDSSLAIGPFPQDANTNNKKELEHVNVDLEEIKYTSVMAHQKGDQSKEDETKNVQATSPIFIDTNFTMDQNQENAIINKEIIDKENSVNQMELEECDNIVEIQSAKGVTEQTSIVLENKGIGDKAELEVPATSLEYSLSQEVINYNDELLKKITINKFDLTDYYKNSVTSQNNKVQEGSYITTPTTTIASLNSELKIHENDKVKAEIFKDNNEYFCSTDKNIGFEGTCRKLHNNNSSVLETPDLERILVPFLNNQDFSPAEFKNSIDDPSVKQKIRTVVVDENLHKPGTSRQDTLVHDESKEVHPAELEKIQNEPQQNLQNPAMIEEIMEHRLPFENQFYLPPANQLSGSSQMKISDGTNDHNYYSNYTSDPVMSIAEDGGEMSLTAKEFTNVILNFGNENEFLDFTSSLMDLDLADENASRRESEPFQSWDNEPKVIVEYNNQSNDTPIVIRGYINDCTGSEPWGQQNSGKNQQSFHDELFNQQGGHANPILAEEITISASESLDANIKMPDANLKFYDMLNITPETVSIDKKEQYQVQMDNTSETPLCLAEKSSSDNGNSRSSEGTGKSKKVVQQLALYKKMKEKQSTQSHMKRNNVEIPSRKCNRTCPRKWTKMSSSPPTKANEVLKSNESEKLSEDYQNKQVINTIPTIGVPLSKPFDLKEVESPSTILTNGTISKYPIEKDKVTKPTNSVANKTKHETSKPIILSDHREKDKHESKNLVTAHKDEDIKSDISKHSPKLSKVDLVCINKTSLERDISTKTKNIHGSKIDHANKRNHLKKLQMSIIQPDTITPSKTTQDTKSSSKALPETTAPSKHTQATKSSYKAIQETKAPSKESIKSVTYPIIPKTTVHRSQDKPTTTIAKHDPYLQNAETSLKDKNHGTTSTVQLHRTQERLRESVSKKSYERSSDQSYNRVSSVSPNSSGRSSRDRSSRGGSETSSFGYDDNEVTFNIYDAVKQRKRAVTKRDSSVENKSRCDYKTRRNKRKKSPDGYQALKKSKTPSSAEDNEIQERIPTTDLKEMRVTSSTQYTAHPTASGNQNNFSSSYPVNRTSRDNNRDRDKRNAVESSSKSKSQKTYRSTEDVFDRLLSQGNTNPFFNNPHQATSSNSKSDRPDQYSYKRCIDRSVNDSNYSNKRRLEDQSSIRKNDRGVRPESSQRNPNYRSNMESNRSQLGQRPSTDYYHKYTPTYPSRDREDIYSPRKSSSSRQSQQLSSYGSSNSNVSNLYRRNESHQKTPNTSLYTAKCNQLSDEKKNELLEDLRNVVQMQLNKSSKSNNSEADWYQGIEPLLSENLHGFNKRE